MSAIKTSLLPLLRERFPGALFDDTDPDLIVTFSGPPEVGDLEIWDDGSEATVAIGKLTHTHINGYDSYPRDQNHSDEEVVKRVTQEVLQFLEDFFAERIVVWREPDSKCVAIGPIETMPSPFPAGGEAFSWKGRIHPKAG